MRKELFFLIFFVSSIIFLYQPLQTESLKEQNNIESTESSKILKIDKKYNLYTHFLSNLEFKYPNEWSLNDTRNEIILYSPRDFLNSINENLFNKTSFAMIQILHLNLKEETQSSLEEKFTNFFKVFGHQYINKNLSAKEKNFTDIKDLVKIFKTVAHLKFNIGNNMLYQYDQKIGNHKTTIFSVQFNESEKQSRLSSTFAIYNNSLYIINFYAIDIKYHSIYYSDFINILKNISIKVK